MQKQKKKNKIHHRVKNAWLVWPYKHTTLVALAILLFILVLDTVIVRTFFEFSSGLGPMGAILAGTLYVSLVTAGPAVVMLLELSKTLDTVPLIILAALGSVVGDYIILRIFRDNIYEEVKRITASLGVKVKVRKKQRKAVNFLLSIFGVFVLGSPLPDELGIAMLGMTHYSKTKILTVAFVANFIGIAFIVLALGQE